MVKDCQKRAPETSESEISASGISYSEKVNDNTLTSNKPPIAKKPTHVCSVEAQNKLNNKPSVPKKPTWTGVVQLSNKHLPNEHRTNEESNNKLPRPPIAKKPLFHTHQGGGGG